MQKTEGVETRPFMGIMRCMNLIAAIILIAMVADFILNGIADMLNLKALRTEIPESFRGVYDPQRYRRSQDYLKVNTRFGRITSLFDLLLILVFWFAGGFPLLDGEIRSLHLGPVPTGMVYLGLLILLKSVLTLPFSVYGTFVIENRFGFNTTTPRIFFADLLKGLGVSVLLGAPLAGGVLWFFEYAGGNAWWYCWLAATLYMLGVQFVAPTWILPIFNRFSPLAEGPLKTAIVDYARSIRFPLENVYVMDGSRRSTKSNAFFTGFGRHRRIVLYDTLVERHTVAELIAVLAHEMGHYKKKHIPKMLVIGVVQTGVIFYLLSLFISCQALFDAFYMEEKSVYAGLIFFGMLYAPLDFFTGLWVRMISRSHEFEADRFSVETTDRPGDMADALKKLSVHNLSNLYPHPAYVFLHYSHPPVVERLKRMGDGQETACG